MYRPGKEEALFNGTEKNRSQKSILMQRDSADDTAKKRSKKVLKGCQNILLETTLYDRAVKRVSSPLVFSPLP